jgi:hypothetical protein
MKFSTLAKIITSFRSSARLPESEPPQAEAAAAAPPRREFPDLMASGYRTHDKLSYYFLAIVGRRYADREPVIQRFERLALEYLALANELELHPQDSPRPSYVEELRGEEYIIRAAIQAAHVDVIRANKEYGPNDRDPDRPDPDSSAGFEMTQRLSAL